MDHITGQNIIYIWWPLVKRQGHQRSFEGFLFTSPNTFNILHKSSLSTSLTTRRCEKHNLETNIQSAIAKCLTQTYFSIQSLWNRNNVAVKKAIFFHSILEAIFYFHQPNINHYIISFSIVLQYFYSIFDVVNAFCIWFCSMPCTYIFLFLKIDW